MTELPLAWRIETGKDAEVKVGVPLLDVVRGRGFAVETCAMDKAHDLSPVYDEIEARDVRPIIPLRRTADVQKGFGDPPKCKHGTWKYGGTDYGRKATKWRCPTEECPVSNKWLKADRLDPLVPRHRKRWKDLYKGRGAVEREFGRLKDDWE